MNGWQSIETLPNGGQAFDLKCIGRNSGEQFIIEGCHTVRMFGQWELWGSNNKLSPSLVATHWRPR